MEQDEEDIEDMVDHNHVDSRVYPIATSFATTIASASLKIHRSNRDKETRQGYRVAGKLRSTDQGKIYRAFTHK